MMRDRRRPKMRSSPIRPSRNASGTVTPHYHRVVAFFLFFTTASSTGDATIIIDGVPESLGIRRGVHGEEGWGGGEE